MPTPSGPQWCDLFPTSRALADLEEPFRTGANRFIGSLQAGGASVVISATRRPRQRAYLMHWSWAIARGLPGNMCRPGDEPGVPVAAASVPALEGVDIDWTHGGAPDAAKAAAEAMVKKYGMAVCAALASTHIDGTAIDMTIRWQGSILVKDASGIERPAAAMTDLYPVGKTFGVLKLESDPPHWSANGH